MCCIISHVEEIKKNVNRNIILLKTNNVKIYSASNGCICRNKNVYIFLSFILKLDDLDWSFVASTC